MTLRKADFYIVHAETSRNELIKIKMNAKVEKRPLPLFDIFNQNKWSDRQAKDALDLNGNVILFFGKVRPYKGLKYLLEAMPLVLSQIEATLLIAGEFWEDKRSYSKLIEKLSIGDHVKMVDRFIPNEDVELYFQIGRAHV